MYYYKKGKLSSFSDLRSMQKKSIEMLGKSSHCVFSSFLRIFRRFDGGQTSNWWIDEISSIIPSTEVCDSPNWILPIVLYICSKSQKIIFLSIYSMTAITPEYLPPFPFNSFIIIGNISYSQRKEIYKELNIDMEITLHSSLFLSLHKSNR